MQKKTAPTLAIKVDYPRSEVMGYALPFMRTLPKLLTSPTRGEEILTGWRAALFKDFPKVLYFQKKGFFTVKDPTDTTLVISLDALDPREFIFNARTSMIKILEDDANKLESIIRKGDPSYLTLDMFLFYTIRLGLLLSDNRFRSLPDDQKAPLFNRGTSLIFDFAYHFKLTIIEKPIQQYLPPAQPIKSLYIAEKKSPATKGRPDSPSKAKLEKVKWLQTSTDRAQQYINALPIYLRRYTKNEMFKLTEKDFKKRLKEFKFAQSHQNQIQVTLGDKKWVLSIDAIYNRVCKALEEPNNTKEVISLLTASKDNLIQLKIQLEKTLSEVFSQNMETLQEERDLFKKTALKDLEQKALTYESLVGSFSKRTSKTIKEASDSQAGKSNIESSFTSELASTISDSEPNNITRKELLEAICNFMNNAPDFLKEEENYKKLMRFKTTLEKQLDQLSKTQAARISAHHERAQRIKEKINALGLQLDKFDEYFNAFTLERLEQLNQLTHTEFQKTSEEILCFESNTLQMCEQFEKEAESELASITPTFHSVQDKYSLTLRQSKERFKKIASSNPVFLLKKQRKTMLDTLFTSHTNIHKETLRSINAFIIKARDNPNSMSLTQTQSNFFHKRKQYRLRPSKRKPTKAESSYPLKSANEGLNIISGRIKALEKVLEKFPKDSNQYSALLAFKEEYHAHNNELKALIERQYAKQAEDKDGCSLPRLPALSSRERKTKGENNTTADTFVSLPKL